MEYPSYGKSEKSIMRFENPDIAGELLYADSVMGSENWDYMNI